MPYFLSSKKFWVAFATSSLAILNRKLGFGLSDADVLTVAGLAGAYVVGQGIADGGAPKAAAISAAAADPALKR